MRSELTRRAGNADKLETLFRSRPNTWISITTLAHVGGIGGFRTRISELRLRKEDPLDIVNNKQNGMKSAYMLRIYQPVGRDAGVPSVQPSLW